MGFSPSSDFDLSRTIGPRSTSFESRPNIVLIQCESFSMYKSPMSGNPLHTTPFFDSLSRQGIFFDRCFAPTFSTALALFAIVTGIPDLQFFKFSSRNPLALDQYTLLSGLNDYEKHLPLLRMLPIRSALLPMIITWCASSIPAKSNYICLLPVLIRFLHRSGAASSDRFLNWPWRSLRRLVI